MKKYVKPSVKVVNLKSSNDIAANTFDSLRRHYVKNYIFDQAEKEYQVSVYANSTSAMDQEILTPVEG